MDAEYDSLLFHSLHWLSKENMLNRLAHLLPEVNEFLEIQHKQELRRDISDIRFQNRLAFLADVFLHLNKPNCKLQGVGRNILGLQNKISAFIAKGKLWKTKMQAGKKVAAFPMMNEMVEINSII